MRHQPRPRDIHAHISRHACDALTPGSPDARPDARTCLGRSLTDGTTLAALRIIGMRHASGSACVRRGRAPLKRLAAIAVSTGRAAQTCSVPWLCSRAGLCSRWARRQPIRWFSWQDASVFAGQLLRYRAPLAGDWCRAGASPRTWPFKQRAHRTTPFPRVTDARPRALATGNLHPRQTHDRHRFDSLEDLARRTRVFGYYGGLRLVRATCKRFFERVSEHDALVGRLAQGFRLSYDSNIPFGMAPMRAPHQRRHPQRGSLTPWPHASVLTTVTARSRGPGWFVGHCDRSLPCVDALLPSDAT